MTWTDSVESTSLTSSLAEAEGVLVQTDSKGRLRVSSEQRKRSSRGLSRAGCLPPNSRSGAHVVETKAGEDCGNPKPAGDSQSFASRPFPDYMRAVRCFMKDWEGFLVLARSGWNGLSYDRIGNWRMIRLNEEFIPPPQQEAPSSVKELIRLLKTGSRHDKEVALLELIIAGAEQELTDCLTFPDTDTAMLATAGLWECWLNEEGPDARTEIEHAIKLMERGNYADAEKQFISLCRRFPGWAEPINKHATILYLRGRHTRSIDLCELVLEMKPRHFGAWHGIALCAVKLHHWRRAIEAAKEALQIQPQAKANREIIIFARSKLAGCF